MTCFLPQCQKASKQERTGVVFKFLCTSTLAPWLGRAWPLTLYQSGDVEWQLWTSGRLLKRIVHPKFFSSFINPHFVPNPYEYKRRYFEKMSQVLLCPHSGSQWSSGLLSTLLKIYFFVSYRFGTKWGVSRSNGWCWVLSSVNNIMCLLSLSSCLSRCN